jgi:hypothetical protein
VDTFWLAPPAIVALGSVAIVAVLRAIAAAAEDADAARRRFRRLEDGLIPLRVESRRTRESLDRLHRR